MGPRKLWQIRVSLLVLLLISGALLVASFLLHDNFVWLFTILFVLVCVGVIIRYRFMRRDAYRFLENVAHTLGSSEHGALNRFPLPVLMVGAKREVLWYNGLFRSNVLGDYDIYGSTLDEITQTPVESFYLPNGVDLSYSGKHYTVYGFRSESRKQTVDILYFVDNTMLKNIAMEYRLSRPAVMILVIDNYDELVQNAKESEKSQILGEIDTAIEQYFAETNGFVRRFSQDRYIAMVERRHLDKIIESRFSLLDHTRKIIANERVPATLSIGVGCEGKTMGENEAAARQSLDMALGRGGDQAVVKTLNGYDFYGGISKGIEKHTRVKSRIIATAMLELIETCENVIVMGHRASDLDAIGSAVALAQAIRRLGRPAIVAVDRKTTLASSLINRVSESGSENLFVHPDIAKDYVTRRTLLIIVDTHSPTFVESPELYRMCKNVVVIDHHRKLVTHIDNAVVFHHEPFASSTSEMVTELLQYFGDRCRPTREDAEALLSGIMLDTRNFVIRTGVRTFEAAAYLRRVGADTVAVRKLFSSTMDDYQRRSSLVQNAEIYRNCAIAVSERSFDDIRIVAPQAADELLGITEVDASFVIYNTGNDMSISARSMGDINVQVVMEYLGGGGHHTMAGAQLKGVTAEEAKAQLMKAIDQYHESHSLETNLL